MFVNNVIIKWENSNPNSKFFETKSYFDVFPQTPKTQHHLRTTSWRSFMHYYLNISSTFAHFLQWTCKTSISKLLDSKRGIKKLLPLLLYRMNMKQLAKKMLLPALQRYDNGYCVGGWGKKLFIKSNFRRIKNWKHD